MNQLAILSISDFKLIFRDKSLRIFLAMPLLIFAIILIVVPILSEKYQGVDPYIPLILMGATIQASTMFGFIYSMVLIHEKDVHVATVYGILPVSKEGFVSWRLVIPLILSIIITFVLLIVQPFYTFSFSQMLLLSVLCGLVTPILALLVSILSKNKMEGMTWFKLANLLITIPLAAPFIPGYSFLFGIIPTHWVFQSVDHMVLNESITFPFAIGLFYSFIILFVLIKRFTKVHFR